MSTSMNNNEPRKPMFIEITQPEKFEKIASTTLETTQKLAKRINKLFSAAFADYHGSIVYSIAGNGNNGPQFMVEVHFKPLPKGAVPASDSRVRAFKPIDEVNNPSDVVANLKSIYGTFRNTAAKFELTPEGAEILSEFMLPGTNVDPFKPSSYNAFKSEYVDAPQFGQSPILARITNLDLTKLVRKIYGSKSAEGRRVDHGVSPYGPVMPVNNQAVATTANWRVAIMQIDAEKTFDIASELGIIPTNGSMGIVTGTM
jgi:hypothetical protein